MKFRSCGELQTLCGDCDSENKLFEYQLLNISMAEQLSEVVQKRTY